MNNKTITVKNLDKVVSSNIDSIAHDGEKLYVMFKNGGLYSYKGADMDEYNSLKKAESVGRHFRANIQQGEYEYERLENVTLELEKKLVGPNANDEDEDRQNKLGDSSESK